MMSPLIFAVIAHLRLPERFAKSFHDQAIIFTAWAPLTDRANCVALGTKDSNYKASCQRRNVTVVVLMIAPPSSDAFGAGISGHGTRVLLSQRVALSVPPPPSHRSEPDCPAIASLPLCPNSRSRPVPPFRTSFPAPPNSLSLPLLPYSLSRPGPPQMTLLPPRPKIVSFPARPWMTSLAGVPKIVLLLLSPTMVAGSPLQRTGGWPGGWSGGRTVVGRSEVGTLVSTFKLPPQLKGLPTLQPLTWPSA